MRKKEPCYILTFASTADAILFEKKATAAQLPGRLIPLPPVISAGCGMAWKIKKKEAVNLLSVIHTLDVPIQQIHELLL